MQCCIFFWSSCSAAALPGLVMYVFVSACPCWLWRERQAHYDSYVSMRLGSHCCLTESGQTLHFFTYVLVSRGLHSIVTLWKRQLPTTVRVARCWDSSLLTVGQWYFSGWMSGFKYRVGTSFFFKSIFSLSFHFKVSLGQGVNVCSTFVGHFISWLTTFSCLCDIEVC